MNLSWRKSINIITHGNSALDISLLPTPKDIYNLRKKVDLERGGEVIKDCMS